MAYYLYQNHQLLTKIKYVKSNRYMSALVGLLPVFNMKLVQSSKFLLKASYFYNYQL